MRKKIGMAALILLVGFSLWHVSIKKEVRANSLSVSIIDQGTINEVTIPKDANTVIETGLPAFTKRMVQNSSTTPILEWDVTKMTTFASSKTVRNTMSIREVLPTNFGYVANIYLGNGGANAGSFAGGIAIVSLDKTGKLIDVIVKQGVLGSGFTRSEGGLWMEGNKIFLTGQSQGVKKLFWTFVDGSGHFTSAMLNELPYPVQLGDYADYRYPFNSYLVASMGDSINSKGRNLLYAGAIYHRTVNAPSPNMGGTPYGKIPLFTYNSTSSKFEKETTYLDNESFATIIPSNNMNDDRVNLNIMQVFKRNNDFFMVGNYNAANGDGTSNFNQITIQRFSASGNRLNTYISPVSGTTKFGDVRLLEDMQTATNFYYLLPDATGDVVLFEHPVSGGGIPKKIVTFPPGTKLHIVKDPTDSDLFHFYGSTTGRLADLSSFPTVPTTGGFLSGLLKKDGSSWQILSATGLSADPTIVVDNAYTKNGETVIFGYTGRQNSTIFGFPRIDGKNSNGTWPNTSDTYGFFGKLNEELDYSPLIGIKNSEKGIKVAIDDSALNNQSIVQPDFGWTALDQWLITGSKNGSLENDQSINVYDSYDVEKNTLLGATRVERQKWLNNRINKNFKDLSLPIDWKGLGFDQKKSGPQLVTYFVTDSRQTASHDQVSVTSRWVNAVDGNTSYDSKETVFLRGENFAINKNDVAGLTEQKVKELAKTQAWLGNPASVGSPFTEDMTANPVKPSAKVTLKTPAQLTVIKTATTHAKAKPYPLDINYQDTVEGVTKKVIHRLWVFVTNDNTTVDNGVVLYADDFKVPLKEATSATADSILKKPKYKQTQPGVLAYDYVGQPQTDQTLTPISKGKPDGESKGLSVASSSMAQLTGVTGSTTIPQFDFTYTNPADSKVTTVKVTATVDEEKEFCFKLERTNDKLIIVEPIIDATVSGNYQSIEVTVPIHVTLDTPVTLPTGWQSLPAVTTATTRTYQYNMKGKNAKAQVIDFLEALKLTIGPPVDKPGEVLITLREDELLANTPPKTKMATKVLRASQVITTNDFRLEAESKWDDVAEVNYVDLEWEKIPNLSQKGYQLYQSENGTIWNNRSLNYNKAIKVLNVYPDLAGSNTLKSWMDGLGLKDGGGNNLIQVTPVSWANYNANSAAYLKNGAGEFLYDVIMFGTWDGNNGAKLTSLTAYNNTRAFSNSGRGILFGHDVIAEHLDLAKPDYLLNYRADLGIGFHPTLPAVPSGWRVPSNYWNVGTTVKLLNDGYLMKYPYTMANGAVLTIPLAHNIELSKKDVGTVWMEFQGATNPIFDNGSWRSNWYLKTNNNVGMIQTGHSSGASTVDERKIIANTLYNLAQVSFDNHGVDYTVKDNVPPVITTMTRNASNQVTVDGKDTGKTYQFYVTADTKDKGQLKSDVVKEEVVSDMKGYVYVIDANPTTTPTVTKDAFGKVTNINAPVVNPEVSRQATFAGFTSQNQWLHVVPVDRAHNVGAVKHIQMKDIPYTEPPESINCTGVIPQKVYIKGKDDQGQSLTAGDQVLQTALRIGKQLPFTPTTIPWYDYVELRELDSTVITPEVVTVVGTKRDVAAIYTRSLTQLHIRQVVLSPHAALVEPVRGEGTVLNTTTLGGTARARLPVTYPTQLDALAGFKTITYEVNTADPFYQIEAILPEYYAYDGYVLTTSNTAHSAALKVAGRPQWTITSAPEVWVTLYLKPTQSPGFYGWQYGNDSGYTLIP